MKILIGCECSGVVRDAFTRLGHDAWSCDIQPTDAPGKHFQCDIFEVIDMGWDMAIFHPPCTHLAVSGARWFKDKIVEQAEALEFVRRLMRCKIPRWALENPVSIISTRIRKPDCILQPWMFGHGEQKGTCLWLRNLPPLRPTNIVDGREQKVWKMGPSPDRAKKRSVTYAGIGAAMADQWGSLPVIPYKFQLGDLL